ncbi:N-acetylmannosamine-6-phosphate 2-epimerase [Paenibacillus psychroresistens]|uniref:Putative N-acetylmannosamine-6-phosphate 2-epimerase n=2 Tax=Paenibacillus psychroresistens TaxID=1778678 RepID=A0A6B8RY35_9BACL|nr:N-acetylmannosamine-6-phosphate 2-epimerase [Paenibacillus psychroresistens]
MDRGLVVSCQSFPGEPLYGPNYMASMAKAAVIGGAVGIRANSPEQIAEIKQEVQLPIIGLWKREFAGFDVYITPRFEDAKAVFEAGADVVAIDATHRPRPDGLTLEQTIRMLRELQIPVMADISTYEEGIAAEAYGADFISTTLSGYTSYSPQQKGPDLRLLARLAGIVRVPVVAEGRISTPQHAVQALELGATFVVVGGAITRPHQIVTGFTDALRSFDESVTVR